MTGQLWGPSCGRRVPNPCNYVATAPRPPASLRYPSSDSPHAVHSPDLAIPSLYQRRKPLVHNAATPTTSTSTRSLNQRRGAPPK